MPILLHSVTQCRARDSRRLLVACPASVPVGALLVFAPSVRAIADVALAHDFEKPTGWTLQKRKTNWVATAGYRELYAYSKFKAAGDESWIFRSTTQIPSRAGLLLAFTGVSANGVIESQDAASTSDTSPHTITGITGGAIGNVWLALTTRQRSDISGGPAGFSVAGDARQSGDGDRVGSSAITAFWQTLAATGATGNSSYTPTAADDYCTISLELEAATAAITVTEATLGGYSVPELQGVPRLAHSIDPTLSEFDALVGREHVTPVLLAEFSPLEHDGPDAAGVAEWFSSKFYTPAYLPAIQGFPSLRRSVDESDDAPKIGGGFSVTVGEIQLLNDRAAVPDVD